MSTLPEEYVHIWKKRISWLKVLFLIGRVAFRSRALSPQAANDNELIETTHLCVSSRYGTLISQTLSIWTVKADISPGLSRFLSHVSSFLLSYV